MLSLYPCDVGDAATLAGIDLQLIYGDYDPLLHTEEFMYVLLSLTVDSTFTPNLYLYLSSFRVHGDDL